MQILGQGLLFGCLPRGEAVKEESELRKYERSYAVCELRDLPDTNGREFFLFAFVRVHSRLNLRLPPVEPFEKLDAPACA
jgi:hypothetical protein